MMSFGWRPNNSCYIASAKAPATDEQVGACASAPTWFYVLLAAAAIGGLATRGNRK